MIPFDKSLLHVFATWLALAGIAWGLLRLREWAARAWAERPRADACEGVDLLDD
jgi:hypothetical protein